MSEILNTSADQFTVYINNKIKCYQIYTSITISMAILITMFQIYVLFNFILKSANKKLEKYCFPLKFMKKVFVIELLIHILINVYLFTMGPVTGVDILYVYTFCKVLIGIETAFMIIFALLICIFSIIPLTYNNALGSDFYNFNVFGFVILLLYGIAVQIISTVFTVVIFVNLNYIDLYMAFIIISYIFRYLTFVIISRLINTCDNDKKDKELIKDIY
jgi:hypothetical protein